MKSHPSHDNLPPSTRAPTAPIAATAGRQSFSPSNNVHQRGTDDQVRHDRSAGAMTSAGRAAHSDALHVAEESLSLAQPYRPEQRGIERIEPTSILRARV